MSGWNMAGVRYASEERLVAESNASLVLLAEEGQAWDHVELNFEVRLDGKPIWLDLDPWFIELNPADSTLTVSKYSHGNVFYNDDVTLDGVEWTAISISLSRGQLHVEVGIFQRNYSHDVYDTRTGYVRLILSAGVQFSRPQVMVRGSDYRTPTRLAREGHVPIEVTIDFFDDMLLTSFNEKMLDKLFEKTAALGATRACWIHHGPRGNGFWESFPMPEATRHFHETFDVVGNDYLPAAVASAHRAGLKLTGIFKPFDTAICHVTAPVTSGADALGGKLVQAFNFPVAHPHLCMQRRPESAADEPIAGITIQSRRVLPAIRLEDVQLWVSQDNSRYDPYDGPVDLRVDANRITIQGLQTTARFILLHFSSAVAADIRQTADRIVTAQDAQGYVVACTPGLYRRRVRQEGFHLDRRVIDLDPLSNGMHYDYAGHGVPSAVLNSALIENQIVSPANSDGFLGVARGMNAHVPGTLSEAMPETHAFWMNYIEDMLLAGVDSVEIRMQNHGNVLDWRNYGWNQPLIDAYRERYGGDPANDPITRERMQSLRGEFFTVFLKQASQRVRAAGRTFHLHIEDLCQGSSTEPAPMAIHLPWRDWLTPSLCDGVTLKAMNHWSLRTGFAADVLDQCQKAGIPVSFCPFLHLVYADPHRDRIVDDMRTLPVAAWNLYEFATLYSFKPDGSVSAEGPAAAWVESLCQS